MPNSPVDRLPAPYAVAVHDAGAANMITAWVAAAKTPPARVLAAGPARRIWRQRCGEEAALCEVPQALDGMASALTGTGWASDFEHRARGAAARLGMRSVAVVDHWVNYLSRFERGGCTHMPAVIWVGDKDALRMAKRAFPDTRVEDHPNLYLVEQAREAGPVPMAGDAVFLMEPARSDWGGSAAGEFQALDFFMKNRAKAGVSPGTLIRLRPHPSDPPGKHDAWLSRHPEVKRDTSPDMARALRDAHFVVGLHSTGLVIGLEAGRTAITALPPWAPPCVLPHKGIVKLAAL